MRHSERNGYHVFCWPEGPRFFFRDIWNQFPNLVVDRYLVNTSFDSGFLTLSQDEIQQGWFTIGNLAHSPRIDSVGSVPNDNYDEYLVFEESVQISQFRTFVNYCGFNPSNVKLASELEVFWEQVIRLRPLHVIGQNETLYLVTRDDDLASSIKRFEAEEGNLRSADS